MKGRFIAVIDSGIGGLSLLRDLIKNFPNEEFLYFGDNGNAPYGNKNNSELERITMQNIFFVMSYGVKAIVFACNTISVNVMGKIKRYVDVPIFGIFPPVESMVMRGKKTLLFCTERTAENYRGIIGVDVVGLPTLAKEIENNALHLCGFNAVNIIFNCHNGKFIKEKGYYDTIILGCTHFVFIKNQILDHFCPQKITTGNEFTINEISKYFKNEKSLVKYKGFSILFIGKYGEFNKIIFEKSGQNY